MYVLLDYQMRPKKRAAQRERCIHTEGYRYVMWRLVTYLLTYLLTYYYLYYY